MMRMPALFACLFTAFASASNAVDDLLNSGVEITPSQISFEPNFSAEGYRGCYPGNSLHDSAPSPGREYFAIDNTGGMHPLEVIAESEGSTEVQCPNLAYTGKVSVFSRDNFNGFLYDSATFLFDYKPAPFPQILSVEVEHDSSSLHIRQKGFSTSYTIEYGFGSYNIDAGTAGLAEFSIDLTGGPEENSISVLSSGNQAFAIPVIIRDQPVTPDVLADLSDHEQGVEYEINGVPFTPSTPMSMQFYRGEPTYLTRDGEIYLVAVPDGGEKLIFSPESTADFFCGECDTSELSEIRNILVSEMAGNGLDESTREIAYILSSMSAISTGANAISAHLSSLQAELPEGNINNGARPPEIETNIPMNRLKFDFNEDTREVTVANRSWGPMSIAVTPDYRYLCQNRTKQHNPTELRPATDIFERVMVSNMGDLNSTSFKVSGDGYDVIEVVTPGMDKDYYPFASAEDFAIQHPECADLIEVQSDINFDANFTYLYNLFYNVGSALISIPKSVTNYAGAGPSLEAFKLLGDAIMLDRTFRDLVKAGKDAEALDYMFQFAALAVSGRKATPGCDALCGLNADVASSTLKNISVKPDESDRDKMLLAIADDVINGAVGLASEVISSRVKAVVALADTGISTFVFFVENYALDELTMLSTPAVTPHIERFTDTVVDISVHSRVGVIGKNLSNGRYFVKQGRSEVEYTPIIHSKPEKGVNGYITIHQGTFSAGSDAELIVKTNFGDIIRKQPLMMFDSNAHPLKIVFNQGNRYQTLSVTANKLIVPEGITLSTPIRILWQGNVVLETKPYSYYVYTSSGALRELKRTINISHSSTSFMPVKRSEIGGRPTLYNEQALMPGLYVIQHKDLSGNWVDYPVPIVVKGGFVSGHWCNFGVHDLTVDTSFRSINGRSGSLSLQPNMNLIQSTEQVVTPGACFDSEPVPIWYSLFLDGDMYYNETLLVDPSCKFNCEKDPSKGSKATFHIHLGESLSHPIHFDNSKKLIYSSGSFGVTKTLTFIPEQAY